MAKRFSWGHININVGDLEASIAFYRRLGFETLLPAIPYLNLSSELQGGTHEGSAAALGLPEAPVGRACIMQLDDGFPKLDLTEFTGLQQRAPLQNKDKGMVRFCLVSGNLALDYQSLLDEGVEFITPPQPCQDRLADVAICIDPDGTLIELLQVYLERWR